MGVGKSINRVDAVEKVTGRAKYTDDIYRGKMYIAKILHSTIANGMVKSIDTSEAEKIDGVVKIVTCFEVPDIEFTTPGHPWTVDPAHQEVFDRKLLNKRVRLYGDDIAAVIALDEVAASRALRAMKVEYEEYQPLITPDEAMADGADAIHDIRPNNIFASSSYDTGEKPYNEYVEGLDNAVEVSGEYSTQMVQHCHIENVISYAYMEKDRIVVVSSTQIPHITRRIIAQALGLPWGKVRVIKPYIGGGFGNKQDVLYEPLNAYLTTLVGGRCVKLETSREETFSSTRTRHSLKFDVDSAVAKDGTLLSKKVDIVSMQGGYASHGHSIGAKAGNEFRWAYEHKNGVQGDVKTVYTNVATAGAMRGYGIPQAAFANEAHMDDIAVKLDMDPVELRLKNIRPEGFYDKLSGYPCHTSGLRECIEKGRDYIGWNDKYGKYKAVTEGDIRKGVGCAIFVYNAGVYPISLETASCRLILNQDGSAGMQMGATEIGQGADTVFTQMAAETTGITEDNIHIISEQDTDVTPFDTGAYASRQSYVSGMAVKKTAELFRRRILDYAGDMVKVSTDKMDIVNNVIVDKDTKEKIISLEDVAMEAFYSMTNSKHITAEATSHCKNNTFSFGACFTEVEVDIPLGKIKILDIINVHDSGVILNPKLAEAQVHGGMSMGLGYALSEQMLYNDKGVLLNDNLLDYKLPTSLDTPDLNVKFVDDIVDPTGPYGNKSLGEPPTCPVAPAIRNAVLNATGVAVNSLPLYPIKLVEHFTKAGLIK